MRRNRRISFITVLAVATLVAASCDVSDVDRLPRATVGKRCAPNGSFARNTTDVLQCVSGRWRVSMSMARAKQLITASQATPTTAAPRTTIPRTPTEGANIEAASSSAGTIVLSGWAFGGTMGVTVDGVPVPSMPWVDTLPGNYPKQASWWLSDLTDRPDVQSAYGARALRSGFKVSVDTRKLATSNVCVGVIVGGALNSDGPTSIRPLSCVNVVVPTPRTSAPNFGKAFIETVTRDGTLIHVTGWALATARGDQDGLPVIELSVNYVPKASVATDIDRPDVGAAYPGTGIRHGFDATFDISGVVCPCTVSVSNGSSWLPDWGTSVQPGTIGGWITLGSATRTFS